MFAFYPAVIRLLDTEINRSAASNFHALNAEKNRHGKDMIIYGTV